jgi:hypothetical protein
MAVDIFRTINYFGQRDLGGCAQKHSPLQPFHVSLHPAHIHNLGKFRLALEDDWSGSPGQAACARRAARL